MQGGRKSRSDLDLSEAALAHPECAHEIDADGDIQWEVAGICGHWNRAGRAFAPRSERTHYQVQWLGEYKEEWVDFPAKIGPGPMVDEYEARIYVPPPLPLPPPPVIVATPEDISSRTTRCASASSQT